MEPCDIKDAILSRSFELRSGEAQVYFWKPIYFPDVPEEGTYEYYVCYFKIVGLEGDKMRKAHGVDSVQALMLAFKIAAIYLYHSDAYEAGDLTYLKQRDLALSLSDGLRADREGYEKVDLLTPTGGNPIVQLPDDRFASIVFEGGHMNDLVQSLAKTVGLIDSDSVEAKERLSTTLKTLESILNYYEAVCRDQKLHLPYVK